MSEEPTAADLAVVAFMGEAIVQVFRDEDPGALQQWIERTGPECLPELFAEAEALSPRARRAVVYALAKSIWEAVPLPSRGFKTASMPRPERNAPCVCGSGEKFKRCCGVGVPPLPALSQELVWATVLDRLDVQDLERLAAAPGAPPQVLGEVAGRWVNQGEPERAIRLAAPLLAHPERLDERDELVLRAWLEGHDALGWDAEGLAMLDRLSARLRPPLATEVWMHRAVDAADGGDWDRALGFLETARRADPHHPRLAVLEVVFLASKGETEKAAARARFHRERLLRRGLDEQDEEALELLERASVDPNSLIEELEQESPPSPVDAPPELVRFLALVHAGCERPLPAYRFEPDPEDPGAGTLAPPADLADSATGWTEVWPYSDGKSRRKAAAWPPGHPLEPELAAGWQDWLRGHPEAFDLVAVLAELLAASLGLAADDDRYVVDRPFIVPLTGRVEAIVERALAGHAAARLPWSLPANRRLLWLLGVRVGLLERQQRPAEALALCRRLLALDPDDHLLVRTRAVDLALHAGEDAEALAIAERYPGGRLAETFYGRAFALHRLGRRGEALVALVEADRALPRVADYLTGRRSRRPKGSLHETPIGGDGQAWYYNDSMGELWRSVPELLDHLKALRRTRPKRR